MDFAKPTIIKIGANGEQLPATSTEHAAVLYPDFGIMFAVNAPGFDIEANYDDTVKRVTELSHAGFSDWILAPDVRLKLLTVDYSRFDPAADPELYPDAKSDWYWTGHATPWARNDDGSPRAFFQVLGSDGDLSNDYRSGKAFARPCRFVARASQ